MEFEGLFHEGAPVTEKAGVPVAEKEEANDNDNDNELEVEEFLPESGNDLDQECATWPHAGDLSMAARQPRLFG